MVPQVAGIVIQQVHRLEDGMRFAFFQRFYRGDVIAQRVALDQVAVVDEQTVFGLGAGLLDQRCRLSQTVFVRRLIRKIIIIDHVHVQIGGLHNSELHSGIGGSFGGRRRKGQGGQACRKNAQDQDALGFAGIVQVHSSFRSGGE
ncbi:hypothetical protein D1872_229450 [compost metagenome]